MLQDIRKYANNFLIKLLLGLLIVSFLIWGIGDILRSANKDYVAVVDGDQYISVIDFVETKKKQLQQLRTVYPNITAEQIKALNLNGTILNQLITTKLLEVEAGKLGILIADNVAIDLITKNPSFFDASGKFDQELFKKILAYNNIPESDYVSQLKNELAVKMLTDTISTQITPNKQLVDAVAAYNNQKASIDLITVAMNSINTPPPSAQAIENFYNANTAKFTIPQYRDLEYLVVSPESYSKKVNVSESELQQELNQNLADSNNQKQYDYYDVIFDSESLAKDALTALKNKGNFTNIVKEFTKVDVKEYLVSNQNAGNIPDNIRLILETLKPGALSDIIKSDIGYHLVKLVKSSTMQIDLKKLTQEVKQQLLSQKIEEVMYSDIKSIEDDLASGKTLKEISKQYNLPLSQIDMVNEQGLSKQGKTHGQVPNFTNITIEAFKLPEAQPSELLNIDESKPGFYIVSTNKIHPAQPLLLAQVKQQIVTELTAINKEQEAGKIASELLAKSTSKDFKDVMKNYGNKASLVSMALDRPTEQDTHASSLIPLDIKVEIFELKTGENSKIFRTSKGDFAFATLQSISKGHVNLNKDEANNLKDGLAYNLSSSLMQNYLAYLEKKYQVKIHSDVIALIED